MPGLEIKLITGSVHLIWFADEHDRERFIRELPALPTVTQYREIEADS